MRLDQAIAARFPGVSRRKARDLLAEHRVLVNERPVSAASRDVRDEDRVAIVESEPDVPIVRITDEWVAVDKPSGIAVQPVRDRTRRSLQEILAVQLKRCGLPHSLFVVHRIDTGTSGLVLFARTQTAAAWLSSLFADRTIRKTYVALIEGSLEDDLRLEAPIDGKDALTLVHPVRQAGRGTLCEIEILTGRTHQIRVHLANAGHPVAGDRRYGSGAIVTGRLMLHAWRLEAPQLGILEAPIPADFL